MNPYWILTLPSIFLKFLWDLVPLLPIVACMWKKEERNLYSFLIPALLLYFKEPENGTEQVEWMEMKKMFSLFLPKRCLLWRDGLAYQWTP